MPINRPLDRNNTGYDSSGINPAAGSPLAPRIPISYPTAGQPATTPLPAASTTSALRGLPTTRPGTATTPVAAPTTPTPTAPATTAPATTAPPQSAPATLSLPSIDGSRYVATANPYTGPAANVPGTTTPTQQVVAPNVGSYQQQTAPTLGQGWQVPDQFASVNTVQDFMGNLLNSGNPYMSNAARRGLESAASRGLLNSSIASGAAQRSAIEAAQPLLSEAMDTLNAREGMKFTQGENSLDRLAQERLQTLTQNFQGSQQDLDRRLQAELQAMGINAEQASTTANRALQLQMSRENNAFSAEQAALDRTQNVNDKLLSNELNLQNMTAENFFRQQMAADNTMQQDWLASQNFSRDFNAALSMVPIKNASDLNNYLMKAALDDPEVYTPEVLSGLSQFFNQNLTALMSQYLPEGIN